MQLLCMQQNLYDIYYIIIFIIISQAIDANKIRDKKKIIIDIKYKETCKTLKESSKSTESFLFKIFVF